MRTTMRRPLQLAVLLLAAGLSLTAQTPLAKPLAEFDKLVSQLTSGSVVGEPVQAGDVTIVPFGAVRFGLGSAGAMIGFGGGMGGKVVPLGVLIVEGDDVRAEQIPEKEGEPSLVREIVQAILDRKVVFMGNGLNIGNAPGSVQELAPLIAAQLGETTVIGNALNLGSLVAPAPAAFPRRGASVGELKRLYEAKKYADALAMANALLAKDPKSTELQAWKARISESITPRESPRR